MEIAGRWGGQADLAGCPMLGFAYTPPCKGEAALAVALGTGSECRV